MASRHDQRGEFWTTLAFVLLAGGCGWRELQHDELFGPPDAGMPDMNSGDDVPETDVATPPDAGAEVALDAAIDEAAEVAPPDAGDPVDLSATEVATDGALVDIPAACTPTSCPADQFCDDLSGTCLPSTGTGMLSGVVFNTCTRKAVAARVGIAGQHQCAVDQKGAYYFRLNLPLGMLTLSAYAEGYKTFSTVVVIKPGGTTQEIALVPDTPNGCADPVPPAVACTCTLPGCVP